MHTEAELRPPLAGSRRGWAEVEFQLEIGLHSLAAQYQDIDVVVVAAINASTTGPRPSRPAP